MTKLKIWRSLEIMDKRVTMFYGFDIYKVEGKYFRKVHVHQTKRINYLSKTPVESCDNLRLD